MSTCTGTTRKGTPCRAKPLKGTDRCLAHSDAETRQKVGFIPDNGKGGRPPNPRAVDVLRERIERDIDKWLKPLEDALYADAGIVVGNGPSALLETLPDHGTRLKSALAALDRVYGRPRQSVEHSGPDGGPVRTEHGVDLSNLSVEERRALLALVAKAKGQ